MPTAAEMLVQKLVDLARQCCAADLNEAETAILCRSVGPDKLTDSATDAARPEVRAGLLRWLATNADAALLLDPKGLRVNSVTVTGDLDLAECKLAIPVAFWQCTFPNQINFDSARTRSITLWNCILKAGLSASGISVEGSFSLTYSSVMGTLSLPGATITGGLELSGSCLDAKGDDADSPDSLIAYDATIGGSVYLGRGFWSYGSVQLYKSSIGGFVECAGGDFGNLSLHNAVVGGDFVWYGIRHPERAWLDLSGARIKHILDDKPGWPRQDNLLLDGLEYDELSFYVTPTPQQLEKSLLPEELPLRVDERVEWLMRQKPALQFNPQPWLQLQNQFAKTGDLAGQKHVLYRLQSLRAEQSRPPWKECLKAYAWLRESPLRILYSITLVVVLGWAIFGIAGASGWMAPTERDAYVNWATDKVPTSAYPRFQPFVYSLENSLPLVKLGQDDRWAPDPPFHEPRRLPVYWLLMWSRWILILMGWLQATVLAAAVSDRFKQ
jgi:hypothetical protein